MNNIEVRKAVDAGRCCFHTQGGCLGSDTVLVLDFHDILVRVCPQHAKRLAVNIKSVTLVLEDGPDHAHPGQSVADTAELKQVLQEYKDKVWTHAQLVSKVDAWLHRFAEDHPSVWPEHSKSVKAAPAWEYKLVKNQDSRALAAEMSAQGWEPLLGIGHYVDETKVYAYNDCTAHSNTIVFYQTMRRLKP